MERGNDVRVIRPAVRATLFVFGALALLGSTGSRATTGTMTITADTTLIEDHFGDIIVDADGIVLDCANWSVIGSGTGIGISVIGRTDVLVTNCHVSNHGTGWLIQNSTNSDFLFNSATGNTSTNGGFYVNGCPFGIRLGMNRSYLNDVGRGFVVRDSTGVRFQSNGALSNGFRGFDVGNSADVNFLKNSADFNGSGGFVAFNSTDLDFKKNFSRNNSSEGFVLLSVSSSSLKGNGSLDNGTHGFRVSGGTSNQLRKNRTSDNGGYGISIQSTGNLIRQNSSLTNFLEDLCDTTCPAPLNSWLANFYGTKCCLLID